MERRYDIRSATPLFCNNGQIKYVYVRQAGHMYNLVCFPQEGIEVVDREWWRLHESTIVGFEQLIDERGNVCHGFELCMKLERSSTM